MFVVNFPYNLQANFHIEEHDYRSLSTSSVPATELLRLLNTLQAPTLVGQLGQNRRARLCKPYARFRL